MNATMAQLHLIDPEAAGLGDYGKPGNYFARQIKRWSQQYESDAEAGRVAAMDRLVEWLPHNIPLDEPRARIIHGDFRCDNMIFHETEAARAGGSRLGAFDPRPSSRRFQLPSD